MLFLNTLYVKTLLIIIVTVISTLLPIVANEEPWIIITWSLFTLLLVSVYIKHLLHPLHCLTNSCKERSLGSIDVFMCKGSNEIMELASSINELLESHQNLSEQKQHIFKEAAHELKSPIAILKARISLFAEKPDGDKKTFAKEAQADLQNITHKLKELLFLKEIEWEMQQLKESFNIKDQCDLMRDAFAPILEKKRLSIITTSSDDFTLHVHKKALAKVMQAIFENIFYHTKNNTTIETTIDRNKRSLEIKNVIGSKSDETLFSSAIGKTIIERIADKMHYTYKTSQKNNIFITTVTFSQ
jgi:signal transduction histidine kinase